MGYPRKYRGFEIFDQSKLGVTDFERRIRVHTCFKRRAFTHHQPDAGRSFGGSRVSAARGTPICEEASPPTASVVLDTVGELSASQVRAIMHLVSHSVEGLVLENITVVDISGQVLSDLIDPQVSPAGLSVSQLQLQRSVEREIERNVQTMLEQVLGSGMVVTRVKAELNFDQREVTSVLQPVVDDEEYCAASKS